MNTRFLVLGFLLFASSLSIFAQTEQPKSDEVIVKETTVIYDRNDVSKEGVINFEQPSIPQSVKDLVVLPSPVELDGMATLAFWIDETDSFTVLIEGRDGSAVEEHKIGDLPKGAHQLVIDMAGIVAGDYKVDVRGKKLHGSTNFSIK